MSADFAGYGVVTAIPGVGSRRISKKITKIKGRENR
jgi:hypothetical protein